MLTFSGVDDDSQVVRRLADRALGVGAEFGTIRVVVQVMLAEHDEVTEALVVERLASVRSNGPFGEAREQ